MTRPKATQREGMKMGVIVICRDESGRYAQPTPKRFLLFSEGREFAGTLPPESDPLPVSVALVMCDNEGYPIEEASL